jgi:hypothetical protein
MPVYFEALKKTFIHPDKISEEIFLNSRQFALVQISKIFRLCAVLECATVRVLGWI